MSQSDVVVVTGSPTVVGLHRLVRALDALLAHGVEADRLLPVVTRGPRSARARAEITQAVTELLGPAGRALTTSPVFVPHRKDLDGLHRDAVPLPQSFCLPLARAVDAVLDRAGRRAAGPSLEDIAVPVRPGSLGGGHRA